MEKVLNIASRREVLWDDYLIDTARTTAEKRLHHPIRRELAIKCNELWEGDVCYFYCILQDDDRIRLYYFAQSTPELYDNPPPESGLEHLRICYAESRDGVHWEKPDLGIVAFNGSTHNNIIFNQDMDDWHDPNAMGCTVFVMKDKNPNCPPDERYKAIYPAYRHNRETGEYYDHTLKCLLSADGIHFRSGGELYKKQGYFDSLNTLHYDEESGKYICYFRGWHTSKDLPCNEDLPQTYDPTREINRIESTDFKIWTDPVRVDFGEDALDFHMYTNVMQRYYRAPHMTVGFPSRYFDRSEWTDNYEQLCGKDLRRLRMRLQPRFGYSVTDNVFVSSRDGIHFERTDEAFFRPDIESDWTWFYGEGHVSAGLFEVPSDLPGGFPELSFLSPLRRWTPDGEGTYIYRYAIRPDGFISRSAGYEEKIVTTKPFLFTGETLTINFETSAAGHVFVEFLDKTDRPLEGYRSCELFGNTIDRKVGFRNDLKKLNGIPVKLRFTLCDADVYSFKFE